MKRKPLPRIKPKFSPSLRKTSRRPHVIDPPRPTKIQSINQTVVPTKHIKKSLLTEILGTLSGSTLGFILGNIPGAIIGGKLGHRFGKEFK